MVHLRTLGELRLLEETESSALSSRRKELVLLAYLARRGPRPLSRAEAAALLWPERDGRRARQSLRQALLELRQLVGTGFIVEAETVQLAAGTVELDADRFEQELNSGQVEAAVARWVGDFLPGAEDVGGEELRGWLEAERERLRRRLGLAFAELVEAAHRRGAWGEGIEWGERWTAALPMDQQGHLRLLRLLHLQERSAEAVARYAKLRLELRALEIEPIPELDQLARQLERGADPEHRARSQSAAVLPPDLIGRGAALAEIRDAWRTVSGGGSAVVTVEGELGIGKTRLCQEFIRGLERDGAKFVVAHARPDAGSHGADPSVIGQLASDLAGAAGLAGAPASSLAVLAAFAPSLTERFPSLPSRPVSRDAIAAAFRDAVGAVADETPTILLVDDLAQADAPSRATLLHLAEHLPAGVLLLTTALAEEDGSSLPPSGSVRRLKLQPLSLEEIELLVGSMLELPAEDRHHLATRLHEHGGGNPFYIVELVSALADDGTLSPDGLGAWKLTDRNAQLPLPAGIRDVLARRLARLTPHARTAIEAAAVLAIPFDRELLVEVAGESPVAVETGLDELCLARLIRKTDPRGQYELTHELVRRHVERSVAVRRSEVLSSRASSALERRVARGQGVDTALQHHRARAARVVASERRRRWSQLAIAAALASVVGLAIALRGGQARTSTSTLAVLPFAVSGAPELGYLGEGMASLLSTQLDGAGALRAVDSRAVLGISGQLRETPPDQLGQQVAERVGAGIYIVGDIVEAAGRIRIAASAYRASEPDRPLVRADVEGSTSKLFELVDGVAGRLLTGLNPGPYEQLTKVAAATTGSLAALKAYLDGERLFRQGNFQPAARAFQRAVVEDTTFGLAYYWLSVASWWADDSEAIDSSAAMAVRYGTRLPERYQRLFLAWEAFLRGDPVEAETIYRQIVELEPENVEAWLQLGEVRFHSGPRRGQPMRAARPAFEQVLFFEPEHTSALLHLARIAAHESQLPTLDSLTRRILGLGTVGEWAVEARALRSFATGDVAEQRRVIAELRTAGEGRVWNIARYLAIAAHSLEGAGQLLRLLTEPTRPAEVRAFGHLALAHLELARGRARTAGEQLDRASALDPLPALEHRALLATVPFLPARREYLASLRDTLSRLRPPRAPTSLATSHLANLHDIVQPELWAYLLSGLSIRLGDSAEARARLEELGRPGRTDARAAVAADAANSIRAQLALRSTHPADATRYLQEVLRLEARVGLIGGSPFYSQGLERYLYARALERQGRLEEAAHWYGSFASNSIFDLIYLGPAQVALGRIAERLGSPEAAIGHYERAVALWLDADPDLRSVPDEARARIAALARADTAKKQRAQAAAGARRDTILTTLGLLDPR
jgi:DNA-binding SARP family transcriptional activator/tetratricopeptide (TPR) repeat protein